MGEDVGVGVGTGLVWVATSVAGTYVETGVESSSRRQAARGVTATSITMRARVTVRISTGQVYEVTVWEVRGSHRGSLV